MSDDPPLAAPVEKDILVRPIVFVLRFVEPVNLRDDLWLGVGARDGGTVWVGRGVTR